jgi:hypothetical protein
MIFTYKEIMDCGGWEALCELHGVHPYAINEGGGGCTVSLTPEQAYCLGILKKRPENAREAYEIYPVWKCNHCGDKAKLHPCGDGSGILLCDKCLSTCIDM